MKTVHAIIEGRVQGVFFRDYTRRQARELGLKGWVKNLPNGSVEAIISGKKEKVKQMIEWFYTGSPMSVVTEVIIDEVLPTEKLSRFEIRY